MPTPHFRLLRLTVDSPTPGADDDDTTLPATIALDVAGVAHALPCADVLTFVVALREGEAHHERGWAVVPRRRGPRVQLDLVRNGRSAVALDLTPGEWDLELDRLAGLCRAALDGAGAHLLSQVLDPLLSGRSSS